MSLFWKTRPKFDSGPYTHHLASAAEINGGAMEFAFDSNMSLPLVSFRGAARLAGEFKAIRSGGEPIISLHPIGAPQGQPFINGEWWIQDSEQAPTGGGVGPTQQEFVPTGY